MSQTERIERSDQGIIYLFLNALLLYQSVRSMGAVKKLVTLVDEGKIDDVLCLNNRGYLDFSKGGTTSVMYGTDDIAKYQYNMIENPGPLAEMPNQPAKNFYGGRYNMEVLQEDRIMYRAGNAKNPYGRWFTSEPPASVANVRVDTAVKVQWIDPKTGAWESSSYIDYVYAIKIPKGTTIYTGPVGRKVEHIWEDIILCKHI